MRDIHGNAHVRKMEPVRQPNQRHGNDMMRNQLLEVFPRLLQHQEQHNSLLRPITRLQQIVRLDNRLVCPMRKAFIHANRIKVPHGRAAHDPDTKRTIQSKVQRGVSLLHEARLLVAVPYTEFNRNGPDEALHAELACKAQHDDVEADKSKVAAALAVMLRAIGVGAHVFGDEGVVACERVGEEEAGGQRVRFVGVDGVERDDG